MSEAMREQNETGVPQTRAGFVALVGEPNVGKSTLMNAILGIKLSIVTKKPQTTRKRVLGIHTENDVQMVFLDTPGILTPKYELHRSMMEYVRDAIETADVILLILDASRKQASLEFIEQKLKMSMAQVNKPVVVVLNKMDLYHDKKEALPLIAGLLKLPGIKEVVPVSALRKENIAELIKTVGSYIPAHPYYYDPEYLSEQPERFFVAELIREAVFTGYKQEIPYSTEIHINEFKERENGVFYISADIVVERSSQKGIVIGKQGEMLKKTGTKARMAIQEHLGNPVFLELFVKVREDWRNNKNMLQSFGY